MLLSKGEVSIVLEVFPQFLVLSHTQELCDDLMEQESNLNGDKMWTYHQKGKYCTIFCSEF